METTFPLRLESYFYIHDFVEPNPKFNPNEPSEYNVNVSATIEKNKEIFCCAVNIALNVSTSKNYSYNYKIQNYGIFDVDENIPEEDALQLIKETGIPILIGAIRERLVNQTASGPFSSLFLAPVRLDNIRIEK